ncbi:MAG: TolC family protein [Coprobacter sp.]|nr:TolC family protein [Coprobacter sp.]
MFRNIFRIFLCSWAVVSSSLPAQNRAIELTIEQSVQRLREQNQSLKIAGQEIASARNAHRQVSSFWYPRIGASGAYIHTSDKIEVKESLKQFTDPAKDFVQSILPDDQLIAAVLDQIGSHSLTLPLAPRNLTTIDAQIVWPVFTGGKRFYAGKISRTAVSLAENGREQTAAGLQILLVESYYGLRLNQRVETVRQETYLSLQQHYRNALKLEANGMITKAERLFVQVSMDEARRELETARNNLSVAQNALKALINEESESDIRPVSALFVNDTLPPVAYFKEVTAGRNYTLNRLRMQENIIGSELKMNRAGYLPEIALFGKQTLYAHGINRHLVPRSVIGVGFTWNLFDGLERERKIRQTQISQQTLAISREKAMTDLSVAVDKFYSQLQNALDNISALNTTIELCQELVRMRKRSFAEGMATSTEVVDAEVMLSKARIASLLAYYQYDVALINLLATCGIPEDFYTYSRTGRSELGLFEP